MDVKICGLTSEEAVDAAVSAGASHVGFVFYPPSPRAVTPERAAELARRVPAHVKTVALFVDAEDGLLERVARLVRPAVFQLHGQESPERVAAIKARFGVEAMKAVRVATADDARSAEAYDGIADTILFDAKPPKNLDRLPGGNGLSFDWTALSGYRGHTPWMLAGGLDAGNVAAAIRMTGAKAVDTSSGVEDEPGVKNLAKIRAFLAAAHAA